MWTVDSAVLITLICRCYQIPPLLIIKFNRNIKFQLRDKNGKFNFKSLWKNFFISKLESNLRDEVGLLGMDFSGILNVQVSNCKPLQLLIYFPSPSIHSKIQSINLLSVIHMHSHNTSDVRKMKKGKLKCNNPTYWNP